jgi:hypothetical protein
MQWTNRFSRNEYLMMTQMTDLENGTAERLSPQRVEKWMPVAGLWEKESTTYLGADQKETREPYGILLAAPRFRDGTISTNIKLSRNESSITIESFCKELQ